MEYINLFYKGIDAIINWDILHIKSAFCLGLMSLLNIWGHIATVPACSSVTLTNVLPHRNAMPQTQDMTSELVTVCRHGVILSLCYPLMWNVTLEYTTTYLNVLGQTRSGNASPTFHTHTHQRTLESVQYPPGLDPGTCGVRINHAIRSPTATFLRSEIIIIHSSQVDEQRSVYSAPECLQISVYNTCTLLWNKWKIRRCQFRCSW